MASSCPRRVIALRICVRTAGSGVLRTSRRTDGGTTTSIDRSSARASNASTSPRVAMYDQTLVSRITRLLVCVVLLGRAAPHNHRSTNAPSSRVDPHDRHDSTLAAGDVAARRPRRPSTGRRARRCKLRAAAPALRRQVRPCRALPSVGHAALYTDKRGDAAVPGVRLVALASLEVGSAYSRGSTR